MVILIYNKKNNNERDYFREVIDGEELESYAEAFKDVKEAEKFFIEKLKILCPQIEDDEITSYLEDGYFADDTHFSLIIKEIPLR